MQIACKRFSCQKAVEVCYWACKYRRDCKDWHGALDATPGVEAITERLVAAAKKSGRAFDPQTIALTSSGKKKSKKSRAAVISKSSSAHLQSRSISAARDTVVSPEPGEPISHNTTTTTNHGKVKATMTEDNLDNPTATETVSTTEADAEESTKPSAAKSAAAKAKPKPVAKPKPASLPTGPVYLLLYANGKYKELRESELSTEAAGILKDPSTRLVKGQYLIPQISFTLAEE